MMASLKSALSLSSHLSLEPLPATEPVGGAYGESGKGQETREEVLSTVRPISTWPITFTLAKGVGFRRLQVTVLSLLEKEENTEQNQRARRKN